MNQPPLTLRDFLESFVDENSDADCSDVLLDVTPQEVEDLGLFFVRGICGWMCNLRRARQKHLLLDVDVDVTEAREGEESRELVQ